MSDINAAVTLAEAQAILGTRLAPSDLPPAFAEPLTIRKLTGLTVYAALGMLDRGCALAIATDAANGVRDDGSRAIVLCCELPAPRWRWCDPNDLSDPLPDEAVRMPTICVPVDTMAHDLAHRVSEIRRGKAVLN